MSMIQEENGKNLLSLKGELENCQQNMKNTKSSLDKTKASLSDREEKLAALQAKMQHLEKSALEADSNSKKAAGKIEELSRSNQELKDTTILLEKRLADSLEKQRCLILNK